MIKILFLDVDGTLTNGDVYISDSGEAFKQFNVKDGLGITVLLPRAQITPVIITGRKSKALRLRCRELQISNIYEGVSDKLATMEDIVYRKGIDLSQCAYMGDDLNDLDCIKKVNEYGGITACPYNACESVRRVCYYVSKFNGGSGAVRDFIEYLLCSDDVNQF